MILYRFALFYDFPFNVAGDFVFFLVPDIFSKGYVVENLSVLNKFCFRGSYVKKFFYVNNICNGIFLYYIVVWTFLT